MVEHFGPGKIDDWLGGGLRESVGVGESVSEWVESAYVNFWSVRR